jgi:hypothetical protein
MEYVLPVLLTLACFCSIIVLMKQIEHRALRIKKYRQSDIRQMLKPILSISAKSVSKKTQMDKMLEKNSVSVMVVDDQAYWVLNNVFYTAQFDDGNFNPEEAEPVDTSSLSKKDVEKMFFILDNLGDGNTNDSGSSR